MQRKRVKAYRSGVFAETLAAMLFRLKGYGIVARRYKTPVGEINLVALKGTQLAYKQRRRIVRAAQYWLSAHPGFANHDLALDVVLTAPWTWPRTVENAFPV
jgi:putative endonuclease